MSPSENVDVMQINSPANNSADWTNVAAKMAMASIGSQGTMGGLLVAGFVSYICINNSSFNKAVINIQWHCGRMSV
jgi:hypothetical protein